MAIVAIANGVSITIQEDGDYFDGNGVKVTKVVANGVTVWEKKQILSSFSPSNKDILDYINITNYSSSNDYKCSSHPNSPVFGASVWNCDEGHGNSNARTYVITPKAPYTKMTLSFHGVYVVECNPWELGGGEDCALTVNGQDVIKVTTTDNEDGGWDHDVKDTLTLTDSSFTVYAYAQTDGWDDHWRTISQVCLYDLTLYT